MLVINTADFGSGGWSIPIPRTLSGGVRRQGLKGETVVVVDYWAAAGTAVGDPNGTGVPPGDTGPGSGAIPDPGGSGPLGGGDDGTCHIHHTITFAGIIPALDPGLNGTWTVTWNAGTGRWEGTTTIAGTAWFFLLIPGSDYCAQASNGFRIYGRCHVGAGPCPPSGNYPLEGGTISDTFTVVVG